jgi:hypothetical protein
VVWVFLTLGHPIVGSVAAQTLLGNTPWSSTDTLKGIEDEVVVLYCLTTIMITGGIDEFLIWSEVLSAQSEIFLEQFTCILTYHSICRHHSALSLVSVPV